MIVTPCADPENDPNDWFIEKDGRQYADDVLVPDAELESVAWEARALYREGKEDLILRAALRRRRHARDKCYECPLRLACLTRTLDAADVEYGTKGGYYPEELRKVQREIVRRKRRLQ